MEQTKGKKLCACPSQNFVIIQMNENDHYLFATVEKFYDIVERVHLTENGHVDYKKILAEIWKCSELCMLSYSQASQKFITTSHTL